MTWSFSDSLTSDRDKVRLRIGDTDTNEQLLSNETIDALLTEHSSDIALCSVASCRAIIAQFSRHLDRSAAGLSSNRSVIVTQYRELLRELLKESRLSTGVKYKGSISDSRKQTIDDDSDFVQPSFKKGQHDKDDLAESDEIKWWR